MSDSRLHLLGIRHHGPGSAASVFNALEAIDPASVLIEGPPEADEIIGYASSEGMRPPVAILVYREDDPAQSAFYPFAEYSPEWQAINWALARKRPVRFIDLPAACQFALEREPKDDGLPQGPSRDPLTELALAAGASDGETWWNNIVEQSASGPEVFAAIAGAMGILRAAVEEEKPLSPREARREAHMRLEIAAALEAGEGPTAVVCGAWHVPALRQQTQSPNADKQLLKGLPRVKTTVTWVPWTDSRLAAASGYGAGVISPGWYRHLWTEFHIKGTERDPLKVTAAWQARVADLLRAEGLPAATASVIDASRLAISLASVRGYPLPGLAEMQDASLSALCHGDELLLRLVQRKLVIGDEIGEIGEDIPQMPLAEDLLRWQKKLRLKPSPAEEELAVDLRSEAGLQKSSLLHRLILIGVPWGRLINAQAGRGTFREVWAIAWQPELSVKLAEALRYGATIEHAARNAAFETGENETSLGRVAEVIGLCLNADLPETAERLTLRLQQLSVTNTDVSQLMLAVVPLIQTLRCGTARQMPREALTNLAASLSAEICANLVPASIGLAEQAAQGMFQAMQQYDAAVPLFDDIYQRASWLQALSALEASDAASAFLRGFALRRLYDAQVKDAEQTEFRLSRALSASAPAQEAGQWLEGFLAGAAQLLLNDGRLFGAVDNWLAGLAEAAFIEMLPVLRRSVTSFDAMERRRILEQVKRGAGAALGGESTAPDDPREAEAFMRGLPLLKAILGIGEND